MDRRFPEAERLQAEHLLVVEEELPVGDDAVPGGGRHPVR
jgi:hypothetical protein